MNPFEECACSVSDEIKVVISGLYDGVLLYRCGSCKRFRHRWPIGSRERYLADGWLSENNLYAREVQ